MKVGPSWALLYEYLYCHWNLKLGYNKRISLQQKVCTNSFSFLFLKDLF